MAADLQKHHDATRTLEHSLAERTARCQELEAELEAQMQQVCAEREAERDQLGSDRDAAEQQLQTTQADLTQLHTTHDQLVSEHEHLVTLHAETSAALESQTETSHALDQANQEHSAALASLKGDHATLLAQAETANQRLAQLETELGESSANQVAVEREQERLRQEADNRDGLLVESEAKLEAVRQQLHTRTSELTDARTQATAALAAGRYHATALANLRQRLATALIHNTLLADAQQRVAELGEALEHSRTQIDSHTTAIARAQTELAEEQATTARLSEEADALRTARAEAEANLRALEQQLATVEGQRGAEQQAAHSHALTLENRLQETEAAQAETIQQRDAALNTIAEHRAAAQALIERLAASCTTLADEVTDDDDLAAACQTAATELVYLGEDLESSGQQNNGDAVVVQLQLVFAALSARQHAISEQLSVVSSDNQRYQAEQRELTAELSSSQALVDEERGRNEALAANLTQVEERCATLTQASEQAELTITSLTAERSVLTEQLEQQVHDHSQAAAAAEAQQRTLDEELSAAHNQIQSLEDQLGQLDKQQASLAKHATALIDSMLAHADDFSDLAPTAEPHDLPAALDDIRELRDQVEVHGHETLVGEIGDDLVVVAKRLVSALAAELTEHAKRLVNAEATTNEQAQSVTELESQLAALADDATALEAALAATRDQQTTLQEQHTQLSQQFELTSAASEEWEARAVSAERERNEAAAEVRQLKPRLEDLSGIAEALSEAKAELIRVEAREDEARRVTSGLVTSLRQLATDTLGTTDSVGLASVGDSRRITQASIAIDRAAGAGSSTEASELGADLANRVSEQITSLGAAIAERARERETLRTTIAEMTEQIRQAEQDGEKLTSALHQAEEQRDSLTADLTQAEDQRHQLSEQVASLHQQLEEHASNHANALRQLRAEIAEQQAIVVSLNDDLGSERDSRRAVQRERDQIKHQLDDLRDSHEIEAAALQAGHQRRQAEWETTLAEREQHLASVRGELTACAKSAWNKSDFWPASKPWMADLPKPTRRSPACAPGCAKPTVRQIPNRYVAPWPRPARPGRSWNAMSRIWVASWRVANSGSLRLKSAALSKSAVKPHALLNWKVSWPKPLAA